MNESNNCNLFSNFQSKIFNTVRNFLDKDKNIDSNKPVATSLRIPNELKDFYECLAEAEMTSMNTAIINTLSKVKDQTISEYKKTYSKINDIYDYQVNSFLKIIDSHKVDYNDLIPLLSFLTGEEISRTKLTNKEQLVNLLSKSSQLKLSKLFGYNYDWLQDNASPIYYKWQKFEDRWYKNVTSFTMDIIKNFYLDSTVKNIRFSILCSDANMVKNLISGITPNKNEPITPFIEASRDINGVQVITYHRFESENINYEKCRKHFVILNKMMFMLKSYRIIDFPNGYIVSPQKHDMIRDGSMHLADLFKNTSRSNDLCLDDLLELTPRSLSSDKDDQTIKPNLYHALDCSVIHDLITWTNRDEDSAILTDELLSRCGMSTKELIKYLNLFALNTLSSTGNPIFLHSNEDEKRVLNLNRIREIANEMKSTKLLDTAFG